jgi:hypothetical protein
MNYGYDPLRSHEQTRTLALRLRALVAQSRFTGPHGEQPTVETDGLYTGVRIRKMTHLSSALIADLVTAADAIHASVTGTAQPMTTTIGGTAVDVVA